MARQLIETTCLFSHMLRIASEGGIMLNTKKSEVWTYAKPVKKTQTTKLKKDCGCNKKNKKTAY